MTTNRRPWARTVAVLAVVLTASATASGNRTTTTPVHARFGTAVGSIAVTDVGGRPGRDTPAGRGDAGTPGKSPADHAVPLDAGSAASTVGVLVVDGGRHQCSAAMVTSDSHQLLATAAHCVWLRGRWTLDGAFFVPGYSHGSEPFGRWPVDAAWVPRSWQAANSPIEAVASAHDVAFVRLAADPDGQLAEDVLGAQGIRFDAPAQPQVTAVGYPVTGAFDGEQLEHCTGPAHVEQGGGSPDGGEVLVLDCDMTQGASGGPWLVGDRSTAGWGQVIGVVSSAGDSTLISARYGPEAEDAYRAADTGSGLERAREDDPQ